MKTWTLARRGAVCAAVALLSAGILTAPDPGSAGAATSQGVLTGQGGDALGPIVQKLLRDDTAGLAPDSATYTNVDLDQGIAGFVGTAPNMFSNDFAVSERPLSTAEIAAATTDGRSFAYVPFAATPVALMTLVPVSTYPGGNAPISPAEFCQHIPLTLAELDGIFGVASPPYLNWGDSRLSCSTSSSTPPDGTSIIREGNLDPTMENDAFVSLLDSTPASEAAFGAEFSVIDEAPSEQWPYSGTADGTGITGGDQATLGSVLGLDPETNAPSTSPTLIKLGAIMPVASDWTGDPLGVTWNLPTAAVENGGGAFVAPSAAAAKAAEDDATLAATSDPTTNNLVTFDLTSTDASSYNPYLMMESYLVVPTNGLPADKAEALAQFIRFVVGGTGQADITALGAAPATSAMVTADLKVAQTLDAEAAADPSTTTTSTTSATSSSGSSSSTTSTTLATSAANAGNTGAGGSPSTDGSTTGGLADTGGNPLPILGLGLAFLVFGEVARRIVRRRKSRA
jgi:ABC-type phosphate transport system substrate-binding protein